MFSYSVKHIFKYANYFGCDLEIVALFLFQDKSVSVDSFITVLLRVKLKN